MYVCRYVGMYACICVCVSVFASLSKYLFACLPIDDCRKSLIQNNSERRWQNTQ